ncbi:sodium:solute symporter family domain-containing protein [Ditylenchus destructor]|uniref:Sodium:solute symporter family domain-containing protein n=1 Tax=Ditylenchus destructor TaxID=166010 RepID=A0AAD4MV77_9BILA|nr:sodium:solute symporter family domain-containing protein [Ditylenchus destructor]
MDWIGVLAIVFFYLLILFVGTWASWKKDGRKTGSENQIEEFMLAGRNIGTLVGMFSMAATWVDVVYINGTAEALYNGGILACQAPLGYALALVLGGILFAGPMREAGYVTMLDPFQIKYGQRVGGLMFIPALLGDVCWSAAILSALGATLSMLLDLNMNVSVILSAVVAVFYTLTGGLYAVAYTDVVQLFCIFIGLWVCIPTALLQDKTSDLSVRPEVWIGEIGSFRNKSYWMDSMLLLVFGGIPWQVYFQRVLSSKTPEGAQRLSYVAGLGCIIMAIPPALVGAIARNTDWRLTEYSPRDNGIKSAFIPVDQTSMVVPLVFRYLTPKWVSLIGLGSMSAAVMSSVDSCVLSAASMFAYNIWKLTIRPHASEKEVILVLRFGIIAVGILASILALTINSVYGLWYLSADLIYVTLFPQLMCVVYFNHSNTYGCLLGFAVGMILRLSGGEPMLFFPAGIHYPMYDAESGIQYFPFKTISMLASLTCCIFGSLAAEYLFKSGILKPELDVLGCVVNIDSRSVSMCPAEHLLYNPMRACPLQSQPRMDLLITTERI